jgi:sec-independent protein translocase protein TatC
MSQPQQKQKKLTKSSSILDKDALKRYQPLVGELKSKLIHLVIVFSLTAILGFIFYQNILLFMMDLFRLEGVNLVLTSPYQFIDLAMYTGVVTGMVATFPLFLFYFLGFVKPALQSDEYIMLIKMTPLSIFLFLSGFGFGVWVTQFVITIFSQTTSEFSIANIWDISSFFSQILITGISLAAVFQLPIVLTTLIKLKIVKHRDVVTKRRFVYAGLLLFSAILPPTDLVSLVLLTMIPLFLFESTLLLNRPSKQMVYRK